MYPIRNMKYNYVKSKNYNRKYWRNFRVSGKARGKTHE